MRRKRKITKISDLPSGPPTREDRIERAKAKPIDNVINRRERERNRTNAYREPPATYESPPDVPFQRLADAFATLGRSLPTVEQFNQTSRRLAEILSRMYPGDHNYPGIGNINIIAEAIHQKLPQVDVGFLELHLLGIVARIVQSGAADETEAADYLMSEVPMDTWVEMYGNMARDHTLKFGPFGVTGDSVEMDFTFRHPAATQS